MPPAVILTLAPLDTQAVARSVQSPSCGAIVTFEGTVRNSAQGRRVLFLEYEAYEPLARTHLETLLTEAEARGPDVRAAAAHRLGRVEIGECSVCVAVAAPHRAEAFDACRWLMDTLKATAPIWKKEHFESGAHWIEGPQAVPSVPVIAESRP